MSPSPGARRARRVGAAVLLAAWAGPAFASDTTFDRGADAYRAQDYGAAARLWSRAAEDGSAEALFRLAGLHDLGLGVARDSARAFDLYRRAARGDIPGAAFNAGVMLDAGIGTPQDRRRAVFWYGMAALSGHARAQYNLGLLLAEGQDVPRDPGLAAVWLARAAETLPAARDKLAALVPETGPLRAPDPVGGGRVGTDAVLAWLAAPGPEGSRVYLQLREGGALRTQPVEGNAVRLDVGAGPVAWRVLRMDRAETRYATSPWQEL